MRALDAVRDRDNRIQEHPYRVRAGLMPFLKPYADRVVVDDNALAIPEGFASRLHGVAHEIQEHLGEPRAQAQWRLAGVADGSVFVMDWRALYTTAYIAHVEKGLTHTLFFEAMPYGNQGEVASSLVPFLWMTKDVVVMMAAHPIVESLYWYLNPLSVWVVCLLSVEMGVGTLIGRFILKRRGREIKIVTWGPIAAIVIGAAAFGGIFAWGQGENLYLLYLDVYRRIFGSGT